jgi:hypothetical protein
MVVEGEKGVKFDQNRRGGCRGRGGIREKWSVVCER